MIYVLEGVMFVRAQLGALSVTRDKYEVWYRRADTLSSRRRSLSRCRVSSRLLADSFDAARCREHTIEIARKHLARE